MAGIEDTGSAEESEGNRVLCRIEKGRQIDGPIPNSAHLGNQWWLRKIDQNPMACVIRENFRVKRIIDIDVSAWLEEFQHDMFNI
jgi:hypothetical protein